MLMVIRLRLKRDGSLVEAIKLIMVIGGLSFTFFKTTLKLKLKTRGVSGFMGKHILERSTYHYSMSWKSWRVIRRRVTVL